MFERFPISEQSRLTFDHSFRALVVTQNSLKPEGGVYAALDVRMVDLKVFVCFSALHCSMVVKVEAYEEFDPLFDVSRVGLGEDKIVFVQSAYDKLNKTMRVKREKKCRSLLH